MGTYHVVVSCDNFLVNKTHLEKYLNKIVQQNGANTQIKCIQVDDNLRNFISRFNHLETSSICAINVNEKLDDVNYWWLGYAMGKGLEVLAYSEDMDEINVCHNFQDIMNIYEDVGEFIGAIGDVFSNLTPKNDIYIDDWETQHKPAEIERGGV